MQAEFTRMKIRKLLRILHRDFGYFIVGMTIVYGLSGIYLNHRHDFNPDYKVSITEFRTNLPALEVLTATDLKTALKEVNEDIVYKKHYINSQGDIKIFIENGDVVIDYETGEGVLQYLQRRPLIFPLNKLHRASIGPVWKWVSDTMAVILIFVAVSGLFLLKGNRGLALWGWWLLAAGIAVPLTFIIIYL